MIKIKKLKDIKGMRKSGKLAAQTLDFIEPYIKIGMSTGELNELCHNFIIKNKAVPAPLNYQGFPASICTSINNVVCHGIPSFKDVLKDGDIVNVDITVILDGYHGDTSRTFLVGNVNRETKDLVERSEKAMYKGIEVIKPDIYLYEVGRAIEKYINKFSYSIVRDYSGHGIGKGFHEDPNVLHYYSLENKIKLREGMTFTVEPMINQGKSYEVITNCEDAWTVTTKDGSLSSQFEHTVLVTKDSYEILTKS